MTASDIISSLASGLPDVFGRSEVAKLMPGIIATGTLANLESQKKGPPCYKSRNKVIYTKDTFLVWLKDWFSEGEQSDTPTNGLPATK